MKVLLANGKEARKEKLTLAITAEYLNVVNMTPVR